MANIGNESKLIQEVCNAMVAQYIAYHNGCDLDTISRLEIDAAE